MSLETLYFIAQIIAGVAVVGSLIFVGLQVRDQTREQYIKRIQERAALTADLHKWVIQSPVLQDAMEKAPIGLEAMTEREVSLFTAFVRQGLVIIQLVHVGLQASHDPKPSKSTISTFARLFCTKAFQEWWAIYRVDYAEDVAAFVDSMAAQGRIDGAPGHPRFPGAYAAWGISRDA